MVGISKIYCGRIEPSDRLRYSHGGRHRPIVVFNCTRRCNLNCVHCYSSSGSAKSSDELSTGEIKSMIEDLAEFGAPVLLFSGGEPLMRDGIIDLISFARSAGLRVVISTNGTMIDAKMADELARVDLNYVGVSMDGIGDANDQFRGKQGAFSQALDGIRNCLNRGLRVGLRFTMTGRNISQLPQIFDLIRDEQIPRACFYHLVSTGRGKDILPESLSAEQTRRAVDLIIDRAGELNSNGKSVEILTVDNHADAPYLYMRMLRENSPSADEAMALLKANGGNASGSRIACIKWNGDVFPDQFWQSKPLGNIRERKFSEIWAGEGDEFLSKLRDRKKYLTGRCRQCRFLDICNGNFRARAESHSDTWGDDPACYLTDDEISQAPS